MILDSKESVSASNQQRRGVMEEFSEREIEALAQAFPPVHGAAMLLGLAGVPLEKVPSGVSMSPLEYWWAVSRLIENRVIKDGRRAVLEAAHRQLPYNEAFLPRTDRISSVLFVGVGSGQESLLRADRELREVLNATKDRITVHAAPAAQATDLELVLQRQPDVLHLACHGDGTNLLFDAPDRPGRLVPGQLIADILGLYRERSGVLLRGLVLNACRSAEIAPLFAEVVEVVIAHEGELSDSCAVIFAQKFYEAVPNSPTLVDAAVIAAGNAVLVRSRCAMLRENLRVFQHAN